MKNILHILLLFWINTIFAQTKGFIPTNTNRTERRFALVIGNKDYTSIGTLKNPINDAMDVSKAFQQLGFEVTTITNADYKKMLNGFNVFTKNLQKNDVVVFYYSGHGISYDGKNYLIPTDASITCLKEVEENALTLGRLMSSVEAKNVKNSFVFLDACRNLPNLKPCDVSTREITISKGLVRPVNNPRGSVIVYATREGNTADDNSSDRNGLFTSEFLKHITIPNLGLRQILDRTKKGVESRSNYRQSPARYEEISDDFVFVMTEDKAQNTNNLSQQQLEEMERERVENQALKKEIARLKEEKVVKNQPIQTGKPQISLQPTPKTKLNTQVVIDQLFIPMVFIKGGSFRMGDGRDEGGVFERPVHQVTVSDFYMGKYEVTQQQWEDIMGTNPSEFKDCSECPVENVSWDDIQEFLQKLNQKTGSNYRLPTEAEWEYAAGGGTSKRTRFGNGKDVLSSNEANFDALSPSSYEFISEKYSLEGEYRKKTIRVGTFSPNSLGLYDMTGNVHEWCNDWYQAYTADSQQNPTGVSTGSSRVLRGGSWKDNATYSRISLRNSSSPSNRDENFGFRVVSTK